MQFRPMIFGFCAVWAVALSCSTQAEAADPQNPSGEAVPPGGRVGSPVRPSQPTNRPSQPQPQAAPPVIRPGTPIRPPLTQAPPSQPGPQARPPRGPGGEPNGPPDGRDDRSNRAGGFRQDRPAPQRGEDYRGGDERRRDYGRDRGYEGRREVYRDDRRRDEDRYARRRNFGLGAGVLIIGGLLGYEAYRREDRDLIFDRCDRNFPDFDYETGSFVNEDGDREICPYLVD